MTQNNWTRCISVFVLVLIFCIGVIALISCGGGGGDSDPVGYIRIYNDIMCSDGTYFDMRLAIGGSEILANSATWSPCFPFDPGLYTGTSYLSACGVNYTANHSVNLGENCTFEIHFFLRDGVPSFSQNQECSGSCPYPNDDPSEPPGRL